MRTSIGGLSIFQIAIIFVLLFVGVMCFTINHSKAFMVKDKIITIIQNDGLNSANTDFTLGDNTTDKIGDYLEEAGYTITGGCPDGFEGYDRNGNETSESSASFCIKAYVVSNDLRDSASVVCSDCDIAAGDYMDMIYYEVVVFYQLDIPIIKYFTKFELNGATRVLVKEQE